VKSHGASRNRLLLSNLHLHPEDGGSKVLRKDCVLPHHYVALHNTKPRLKIKLILLVEVKPLGLERNRPIVKRR